MFKKVITLMVLMNLSLVAGKYTIDDSIMPPQIHTTKKQILIPK